MLKSIRIGREDKGKGNITVSEDHKMVGRHHAILWIDEETGAANIEEVDAKNGTFVNGRRIVKSGPLKEDDEVWLGEVGPLGYQVDVKALVSGLRTDYSEEFNKVVGTYEEYAAELKRIEESRRKKTMLPRAVVSLLFAIIALIICFFYKGEDAMTIRITVMTVGSALIAALNLIPFGKNDDIKMQITDLQVRYQDRYCCPKCGAKFNLNNHWKLVRSNHCPNPKCNAKYSK